MVRCEICGKEFKNGAGLVGHMRFVHGESERKYYKKNEVLEGFEELKAKIDRVLAAQEQGIAGLERVGLQNVEDFLKRELRPVAENLASVNKAVNNDLPHMIDGLNTAAAQVGAVVGDTSQAAEGEAVGAGVVKRVKAEDAVDSGKSAVWVPWNFRSSEEIGGKKSKAGWLILAVIGVYGLGAYLNQREAERQGAAVSTENGSMVPA